MTTDSTKPDRLQWLGSNLALGLLVSVLSVFTALANYTTYVVGNVSSNHETEGDRLLADSNTEYIRASQFIIVDYTLYDNYYVNRDLDDFNTGYYQSQFSVSLQASVDRENPFDALYYEEMYMSANTLFNDAFTQFDLANAADEREAGYQLAMLVAAVGLAFAAYASLLDESNRLRKVFALISLIMMVLGIGQFILVSVA